MQSVHGNARAFAALKGDGSVVAWGDPRSGGDASQVSARLRGVARVFATRGAFAALTRGGAVVVWGYPRSGGDASAS